jgi:hypothetical protein
VALSALFLSVSCGKSMMQQGNGSSYLIVDLLQAASGAKPSAFSTMLASDVVTNVTVGTTVVPTVYDDIGQVTLRMALKDQITTGLSPTDTNTITITGYHVDYVPNTPGDAVPASFDGALTGTISTTDTTLSFVLVHAQAKLVAPLVALVGTGNSIMAAAKVTFYGHDQAGHAVSVMASIGITFADWADPAS